MAHSLVMMTLQTKVYRSSQLQSDSDVPQVMIRHGFNVRVLPTVDDKPSVRSESRSQDRQSCLPHALRKNNAP